MKTKVLLSTLAMASMFVACNNEDFVLNEETPQKIENANLLGEGLSLNVSKGEATTRVDENGAWQDKDEVGLGWLTGKNFATSEGDLSKVVNAPSMIHKYVYGCDDNCPGKFNTRSLIYEGWHFAFFPIQYQYAPKQIVVDVNAKEMGANYKMDVNNNAFRISAAEYLDETKIDQKTGTIKPQFDVLRSVNVLHPILNISEDFTKSTKGLAEIKINEILVYSNQPLFQNTLKVVPGKLPVAVYDEYGVYDQQGTWNGFTDNEIFGTNKPLQFDGAANANSVITTIAEDAKSSYKLDGTKDLRVFLAPVKDVSGLTYQNLEIQVRVEGGYFKIDQADESNINALKRLAYLFTGTKDAELNKSGRDFRKVFVDTDETDKVAMYFQPAQKLELNLNLDNFKEDFSNIHDIATWNGAVKLANALGREDVTFNLTGEVKFPEGDMNIPTAKKFTVKSAASNGSMVFEKNTNWNEKIICGENAVISVKEGATLNVNTTLDKVQINNEGTIEAGTEAKLGKSDANPALVNNTNRIIVEYGAFVYAGTEPGTIAYRVKSADAEEITRINTLMKSSGNSKGHANVNTLIVSTVLDINASASATGGSNDPYNGAVAKENSLNDLSDKDIELENGTIIYTKGSNTTVENVTAIKGFTNNVMKDVKMANLANITIQETAALTVEAVGDKDADKKELVVKGDIINDGTFTANTKVTCVNIDNVHGVINANSVEKYGIWYTGKYLQGGVANGQVNKVEDAPTVQATAVKTAWDVLVAYFAEHNCPNTTYSDFLNGTGVTTNPGLNSVSDMTGNTPYINFFNALDDWFQSEGMGTLVATKVTAAQLKRFETETGISFGLKD